MSKVLKKCQPRIVYPAKQEFRNENVMRIFSDKPKLSKFTKLFIKDTMLGKEENSRRIIQEEIEVDFRDPKF